MFPLVSRIAMCGQGRVEPPTFRWRTSGMNPARRQVLSSDDTDTGEERGMNKITATGEPATEL